MKHNINLLDLKKDTHNRALFTHTHWEYAFKNGNPSFIKDQALLITFK